MPLDYSVATEPFPLQAGEVATISVVASNPSPDPDGDPVTVGRIAIEVPIGSGGSALTADATDIVPVPPTGWKLQPNTPRGVYAFVPQGGPIEVRADSLVFALQRVAVNDQPGEVRGFRVRDEHGADAPLPLTKFPASWGRVDFWVDPPDITPGGSTTLNWRGPEGATYRIEYAAGGRVVHVPARDETPLSNQGAYPGAQAPPLRPAETTVFTLQVTLTRGAQQYMTEAQVTVTVTGLPEIKLFTGTLARTRHGYALDVQWAADNADYCTLGDDATQLATKGRRRVALDPPWNGTLELEAVARGGRAPANSTLIFDWTEVGGETPDMTVDLELVRATPDGTGVFAKQGGWLRQLAIAPAPSAAVTRRWNTWWWKITTGFAAAVAPAGALWIVSRASEGVESVIELVSFASDGKWTVLASQPLGQSSRFCQRTLVAASPDGSSVYVWDGTILHAFAVAGGASLSPAWAVQLERSADIWGLAIGPMGTLYMGSADTIRAYAPAQLPPTGSPTASLTLPSTPSSALPRDLTIGGGLLFATVGERSGALCVDCAEMRLIGLPIRLGTASVAATPDGRRLFTLVVQSFGMNETKRIVVLEPVVSGGVPTPASVSGP